MQHSQPPLFINLLSLSLSSLLLTARVESIEDSSRALGLRFSKAGFHSRPFWPILATTVGDDRWALTFFIQNESVESNETKHEILAIRGKGLDFLLVIPIQEYIMV